MQYDAGTGHHFVRYDDGDERWYKMSDREVVVCQDYQHDVVGQRLSIVCDAPPASKDRRHVYVATVVGYDATLDMHRVRWDDGGPIDGAVPLQQQQQQQQQIQPQQPASGAAAASSDPPAVPPPPAPQPSHNPYVVGEEMCNLHVRPHTWMVDVKRLQPGEKILGRRVNLYMGKHRALCPGTITEYHPSEDSLISAASGSRDDAAAASTSRSSVADHHSGAASVAPSSPLLPLHRASRAYSAHDNVSMPSPSPASFAILLGLGNSLVATRSASASLHGHELQIPHSNAGFAAAAGPVSPSPLQLTAAEGPLVPHGSNVEEKSEGKSSPHVAIPSSAPSPMVLARTSTAHGRGSGVQLPSYIPRPVKPDPTAIVQVVLDDGDKVSNVQLRRLDFAWLEDRIPGRPPAPGVVGLLNLGNTCYLNSVLQCLSHIDALAAYCLDDSLVDHLNTGNKMGMQGRMAMAFAELLGHLWGDSSLATQAQPPPPPPGAAASDGTITAINSSTAGEVDSSSGACTALAPGFIKALLSERSSGFNGMGQQDAHEALMCLLDAMHEDLAVYDQAASAAAQEDADRAAEEDSKEREGREKEKAKAAAASLKSGGTAGKSHTAGLSSGAAGSPANGSGQPAAVTDGNANDAHVHASARAASASPPPFPVQPSSAASAPAAVSLQQSDDASSSSSSTTTVPQLPVQHLPPPVPGSESKAAPVAAPAAVDTRPGADKGSNSSSFWKPWARKGSRAEAPVLSPAGQGTGADTAATSPAGAAGRGRDGALPAPGTPHAGVSGGTVSKSASATSLTSLPGLPPSAQASPMHSTTPVVSSLAAAAELRLPPSVAPAAEGKEDYDTGRSDASTAASVAPAAPSARDRANPQPEQSHLAAPAPVPAPRKYVETTSIVKQLFFVQTEQEFVCQKNSKHTTLKHGPRGGEMLPPLPLAAKKETRVGLFRRKVIKEPQLEDCLGNYFTPEAVDRKCDKCGGKTVPMSSRPWLRTLPPVLVIQLKRFDYDFNTNANNKLVDPIPFPLRDLDMAPYLHPSALAALAGNASASAAKEVDPGSRNYPFANSGDGGNAAPVPSSGSGAGAAPAAAASSSATTSTGPSPQPAAPSATTSSASGSITSSSTKYDLFAVVCHVGGPERGHYTAYARSISEAEWWYYDDSSVVPAREEDVASDKVASFAYLLFYAKRMPGAQPPPKSTKHKPAAPVAASAAADKTAANASGATGTGTTSTSAAAALQRAAAQYGSKEDDHPSEGPSMSMGAFVAGEGKDGNRAAAGASNAGKAPSAGPGNSTTTGTSAGTSSHQAAKPTPYMAPSARHAADDGAGSVPEQRYAGNSLADAIAQLATASGLG